MFVENTVTSSLSKERDHEHIGRKVIRIPPLSSLRER